MGTIMARYKPSKWKVYAMNVVWFVVLMAMMYYCLILITDAL